MGGSRQITNPAEIEILQKSFANIGTQKIIEERKIRSYFLYLIINSLQHYDEKFREPNDQSIEKTREELAIIAIANNIVALYADESMDIGTLARQANMSRSKFQHLFKATYGMPPYQYYQDVRLSEARRLIEQGESSTYVALHIGYKNISHFIIAFRQKFGYNPSEIMKK